MCYQAAVAVATGGDGGQSGVAAGVGPSSGDAIDVATGGNPTEYAAALAAIGCPSKYTLFYALDSAGGPS